MNNPTKTRPNTPAINHSPAKLSPVFPWVGGKTRLLPVLGAKYGPVLDETNIYVEPFLGGGAVLLDVLARDLNKARTKNPSAVTPDVGRKYIANDLTWQVINFWRHLQVSPYLLIDTIKRYKARFDSCRDNIGARREVYLKNRALYNELCNDENMKVVVSGTENNTSEARSIELLEIAALFFILLKTGFSGQYRTSLKGYFNVSLGAHATVSFNEPMFLAISAAVKPVVFMCGDYSNTLAHVKDGGGFVFLDPPYRPVGSQKLFYNKHFFGDTQQVELKMFIDTLTHRGNKVLTTNSAPADGFFQTLYDGYSIEEVQVNRLLGKRRNRGKMSELMISNWS